MEDLKCQQNDLLQAGKQDTQLCTFQRSRAVLCFNDVVFINADHQLVEITMTYVLFVRSPSWRVR